MEALLNSEVLAPRQPHRQGGHEVADPQTESRLKPAPASSVRAWASGGVILMLVLSAALNGFANSLHAPVAWAGWLMGLAVPVIVLVLAKVAGREVPRPGRGRSRGSRADPGVPWLLFLSVSITAHIDRGPSDGLAGGSGGAHERGDRLWTRGLRGGTHHRGAGVARAPGRK